MGHPSFLPAEEASEIPLPLALPVVLRLLVFGQLDLIGRILTPTAARVLRLPGLIGFYPGLFVRPPLPGLLLLQPSVSCPRLLLLCGDQPFVGGALILYALPLQLLHLLLVQLLAPCLLPQDGVPRRHRIHLGFTVCRLLFLADRQIQGIRQAVGPPPRTMAAISPATLAPPGTHLLTALPSSTMVLA